MHLHHTVLYISSSTLSSVLAMFLSFRRGCFHPSTSHRHQCFRHDSKYSGLLYWTLSCITGTRKWLLQESKCH
ncbi:hypothetical protein V8C42DRAFT_325910 [Trichoderma barbatum]